MTATCPDPIITDWPTTATARELAHALGQRNLDELRGCQPELAAAVAELAAAAGRAWPRGPDDPVVALLRALAKLSLDAPDASSTYAARLLASLDS
jgi:hypothetical protein